MIRWSLLALGLMAAGGCDRNPAETPDPAAHLYGRYELRAWDGFPLPVEYDMKGFGRASVRSGSIVLSEGGKYEWTQGGALGDFSSVGTFTVKGDSLIVSDGTRLAVDGPALLRAGSQPGAKPSAWVRAGSEIPAAYRYRTYRLATYNGRPVPHLNTEPGLRPIVDRGFLWLWADGRFHRQTDPSGTGSCCAPADAGQYTLAGESLSLSLYGQVETGVVREPNVTVGLFGYVAQPNP